MSSFLWLLLYLAPLLGVTAALFGWLGWSWRNTDLRKRLQELETRLEEMNAARTAGEKEHDDLRVQASKAETELHSLRAELSQVKTSATQERRAAAEAQARAEALQASLTQATHDLEAARLERDQNAAALATVHAELERLRAEPPPALPQPEPPAPAPKTKAPATKGRARTSGPGATKATARPTAKRQGSLHDTLAAVQSHLDAQQSTMETLVRERDDWQRRVTKLESQAIADPAGLGLAYRSLSDSEKRLQAAQAELSRLQTQTRVLQGLEEKAAALTSVPDDDLTKIKGIKNVISEQLRAHGIRTWRQIAEWDDDELRVFSELLAFKNRATREKWKEQARALHEAAHSGQLL